MSLSPWDGLIPTTVCCFILMATCGSPALHLPSALVRIFAPFPLGRLPPPAINGSCLLTWISRGENRPGPVLLGSAEPFTLFPASLPPLRSLLAYRS